MFGTKWKIFFTAASTLVFMGIILLFLNSSLVSQDILIGTIGVVVSFIIAAAVSVRRKKVATLLMVAFLLRLSMAVLYTFYIGDSDPDGYGLRASEIVQGGLSSLFVDVPTGAYFYSWLVAILWLMFGESEFLIRVINALLSFLAIVLAYDLSARLYSARTARIILIILTAFPTLVRFSSSFANRETLLVLIFLLLISLAYKFYTSSKLKYLLASMICLVVATILHTAFFFIGAVLIIGALFLRDKQRDGKISSLPALLILITVAFLMFSSGIGTEKLYLDEGAVDFDKISSIQDGSLASGRAAYLTDVSPTGPADTLISAPIKTIYFLYAPFPWMVKGVLDVVGFIDAAIYALLSIAIYLGFKKSRISNDKKKFIAITMSAVMIGVIVFALGTSNYGTALRHRAKFAIPLVVISGMYYGYRDQRKK